MNLADLFPEGDHRFSMRFQRGGVAEFFAPTEHHAGLIAERRRWLAESSENYSVLLPEGEPLLEEMIELVRTWPQVLPRPEASTAWDRCRTLGETLEPDFLLLKADVGGAFRLLGGCVCFPSSWSLAEKIGRPLDVIHNVVPGLNAALGSQINSFLAGMKPGIAWLRANWGLSRSPELNQHPSRNLPKLDATASLSEVWLRVERQALAVLPRHRGVLFGIRIETYDLAEMRLAGVVKGLARALRTMPEAMAQYKNLALAKERILSLIE